MTTKPAWTKLKVNFPSFDKAGIKVPYIQKVKHKHQATLLEWDPFTSSYIDGRSDPVYFILFHLLSHSTVEEARTIDSCKYTKKRYKGVNEE